MAVVFRSAEVAESPQLRRVPTRSPGTAAPGPAYDERSARRARGVALVVLLGVVLAGLGVGLADLGLLGGSGRGSTHQIGDDIDTSYGVVAVEFVRNVDGVTSRALAGASHGVSGLVDGSHSQIQVAVAITNRGDRPMRASRDQFTLLVRKGGKTTAQQPQAGDLPDMRILPNAGIEGHLDFTIPRADVRLTLLVKDPGRSDPVVIDLGTQTGSPVTPEHTH
jgi:hypothetical protein